MVENHRNEYSFGPQEEQEPQSQSDLLSIDNVFASKPENMYGDLHVSPEGFYFLAYERISAVGMAISGMFGYLGVLFEIFTQRMRKKKMEKWRQEHGNYYLDELIEKLDGSVFVPYQEIEVIKLHFWGISILVRYSRKFKLSIRTNKKQTKQILDFARSQNWPVK